MQNIQSLLAAGLSEKESVTYLDLLHNGASRTGQICIRTKIPSSHIYTLLQSLLHKGLVTYKVANNIKIFSAGDPEMLKQLFEEREAVVKQEKENVLSAIARLKMITPPRERFGDFKYYSGIRGIKSLYTELTNNWKKGDEYCIASAPLSAFSKLEGFFIDVVHKKRVRDQVRLRILVNQKAKQWGSTRQNMPLTQVRYIPIDSETEYGVLNDFFFLISYGDEPYGLLINDRNFAKTYQKIFDLLWKDSQ